MQKEKQIIQSLLWTDHYKQTMGQLVFADYPTIEAKYQFINRGKTAFPSGFAKRLRGQVEMMQDLRLHKDEKSFLKINAPYLKGSYLDWLDNFSFNPDEVEISQQGQDLTVDITGPWKSTIYWEVPLMTTISQLYFEATGQSPSPDYLERAAKKGKLAREHGVKFLEFGTRRAFSTAVHRAVLQELIESAGLVTEGGALVGTSNVALAKEFAIPVSGTYAHELVMGHAAMFGVREANQKTMAAWAKHYLGSEGDLVYPKLSTALMDTYTTDIFLKDLSRFWAETFFNFRQDSGEPVATGEKVIRRLQALGIDPKKRGLICSDGLTMDEAVSLADYFKHQINLLPAIGTSLTNDVGVKPLNMVIKMKALRLESGSWIPTVKLSDDLSKASGDPNKVQQIKQELGL